MIRRGLLLFFVLGAFLVPKQLRAQIVSDTVTFQVHMGVQMQLNNFNPVTDSVVLRGDFENLFGQPDWSGEAFLLSSSITNDSIYSITLIFPSASSGTAYSYKFVIRHNGTDFWENTANRGYTLTTDSVQIIPLVYFQDQASAGVQRTITFQANLDSLMLEGFNPATDSIVVNGEFNNWNSQTAMARVGTTSIYEYSVTMTRPVGDSVQYKFRAFPAFKFANNGWDLLPENSLANRKFVVPTQDSTLPAIRPAIQVLPPPSNRKSAYFDGNARIRVVDTDPANPSANPSAYQISGTAITLEAWIYPMAVPTGNNSEYIVARPSNNGFGIDPFETFALMIYGDPVDVHQPRIGVEISDGTHSVGTGHDHFLHDPNPVNVGAWTHVAATYDGSNIKLYINGSLVNQVSFNIPLGTGSTGLYIGGAATGYFKGMIDEVRLWNIARSQSDIQATMNTTLYGNETGLAGYWSMDSVYSASGGLATVDGTSNHNDLYMQFNAKLLDFPKGSAVQIPATNVIAAPDYAETKDSYKAQLQTDGWPEPSFNVSHMPSGMSAVGDSLFWQPTENQYGNFPVIVTATQSFSSLVDTVNIFSEILRSVQNQVTTDITHRGKLGAIGYYGNRGVVYKGKNGLFAGDFSLVDRASNKFAGGLYSSGNNSFQAASGFTNVTSRFHGFTALKTSFTDSLETNRIGVRVFQTAYASSDTGNDKYTIIEYRIVNESGSPITDLFAQLSMDFDIGLAGNDWGGYDSLLQMSYGYEVGGANNPAYYAVSLLNKTASGAALLLNGQDPNFFRSTANLTNFVQPPATAADTRNQISTGPFAIAARDTLTVAFAVIAGDNLNDISTSASRARQVYNGTTLISVDSINSEIMDTVTVPVRVQIQPGTSYSSAEVRVSGFKGSLQFLGIDTTGTMIGSQHWMYSVNGSDSAIVSASAGASDISGGGVLFKMKFIATGAPCSFASVNIDSAVFNTGTDPVAISNGGVHIKAIPVYGDVDQNGKIQAYDASLILKYLADTLFNCQTFANADVTNNGVVTPFDASVILQYVTGLITGFPYDSLTMGPSSASGVFALHNQEVQKAGDVVEIPVQFTSAHNVKSLEASLSYNPDELDYQDIRWQDTAGFITASSVDVTKGVIKLFGASAASASENGVVANIRFKVKKQSKVLLKELQLNESAQQHDVSTASISVATDVKELESAIPTVYSLSQNYPNPFNPTTAIRFGVPERSLVKVQIINTLGQAVATVVEGEKEAGYYEAQWNASSAASGIYFYRIEAISTDHPNNRFVEVKKMILLK